MKKAGSNPALIQYNQGINLLKTEDHLRLEVEPVSRLVE